MHGYDSGSEVLAQAIVRYAVDRVRLSPPPLDHPRTPDELRSMVGRTVTAEGIGGLEALRLFDRRVEHLRRFVARRSRCGVRRK